MNRIGHTEQPIEPLLSPMGEEANLNRWHPAWTRDWFIARHHRKTITVDRLKSAIAFSFLVLLAFGSYGNPVLSDLHDFLAVCAVVSFFYYYR